jgi:general secretion pathway protein I
MSAASQSRRGFTLLEVMVAVAILAIGLSAVFSAEAGSVRTAQRARKMGLATMLVRCKMGEIEEDLAKKGLPAIYAAGSDKCCKDAEIEGFKCKWELQPIVLPDTMFGEDEDKDKKKSGTGTSGGLGSTGTGLGGLSGLGSGKGLGSGSNPGLTGMLGAAAAAMGFKNGSDSTSSTNSTDPNQDPNNPTKDPTKDPKNPNKSKDPILKQDPKDVLGNDPSHYLQGGSGKEVDGITAMAMQFVYPVLKPAFQSQIRRLTVTVSWLEGQAPKSFDVTQYVVAEQPVNLTMDPNNPNQVLGGTTGTGTTGTGTTGTGFTGSTPTTSSTGTGTH